MVLDKSTFNDAFGGVAWPFSSTTERAIMLGSISYNQTPGIQDPEGSHYVEVGDIIKFDDKFVKGRLRHDFETSANYISTLEPLNETVQVVLSTPSHIWTVAKSGNIYRTEIENVGQNITAADFDDSSDDEETGVFSASADVVFMIFFLPTALPNIPAAATSN